MTELVFEPVCKDNDNSDSYHFLATYPFQDPCKLGPCVIFSYFQKSMRFSFWHIKKLRLRKF